MTFLMCFSCVAGGLLIVAFKGKLFVVLMNRNLNLLIVFLLGVFVLIIVEKEVKGEQRAKALLFSMNFFFCN